MLEVVQVPVDRARVCEPHVLAHLADRGRMTMRLDVLDDEPENRPASPPIVPYSSGAIRAGEAATSQLLDS